jgi:predicted nucleic acid-binding protein
LNPDAIVVDSSVVLKWFIPEVLSEKAELLLNASSALLAPDLLYPEVGNILWKKINRGEINAEEARDVIAGVRHVPLTIVPSSLLLEGALEIAVAHQRTVYDSLYVALAVAYKCAFVTADDKLLNALAGGPFAGNLKALSTYPAAGA